MFSARAKHYSCFPLYKLLLMSPMGHVFSLLSEDAVNMRIKQKAFPVPFLKASHHEATEWLSNSELTNRFHPYPNPNFSKCLPRPTWGKPTSLPKHGYLHSVQDSESDCTVFFALSMPSTRQMLSFSSWLTWGSSQGNKVHELFTLTQKYTGNSWKETLPQRRQGGKWAAARRASNAWGRRGRHAPLAPSLLRYTVNNLKETYW